MDNNKVWFLRSTFHEKAKKNLQGVFLVDVGQKPLI